MADLSIVGLHKLLSSHSGRDKVGKVVHYGSRGICGVLSKLYLDNPLVDKKSIEFQNAEIYNAWFKSLYVKM